ncbi:hypothetical protein FLW53_28510 [Microbispora sp. SCL1-1]|uniref:hypothetical protein n=1 Tax=unclassified Microbispora TaxID=2614687 RepID=UPI00115A6179|nr:MULTISPECIES: hypothetical protein [unclassified Microbispora]NJP28073.1 hypothetical protein [Microbispora sp. CL1-1]TQS09432.1 hypothetical protein FLW53_28510 [Microbispora sp. SCL1-1]
MRPIPGTGEPGATVDDRIADLIARAREQRARTAELRRQMAIRRAYGLRRRHAAKEARTTAEQPPADDMETPA